jgi:hypothetical protein
MLLWRKHFKQTCESHITRLTVCYKVILKDLKAEYDSVHLGIKDWNTEFRFYINEMLEQGVKKSSFLIIFRSAVFLHSHLYMAVILVVKCEHLLVFFDRDPSVLGCAMSTCKWLLTFWRSVVLLKHNSSPVSWSLNPGRCKLFGIILFSFWQIV